MTQNSPRGISTGRPAKQEVSPKASRAVKRDAETGRFADTFTIRDNSGVRTIHTSRASTRVMDEAVEKYKNALKRLADK